MSGNFSGAKVSQPVFLGVMWTGTALASILLAFRIVVRLKAFKKLGLDDALVIFAWAILLTSSIIWQVVAWRLYEEYAVVTGQESFSFGFIDRYSVFIHKIAVFNICFYTALWSVKISFLLFFKKLGSRARGFKTWWWICLVVTVLCWIPCIADINWKCSVYPVMDILTYCTTLESIRFNTSSFISNCVLDLFSDILVISVPIIMLWPVRLPWRQKLMLMGLFSATIFIMVIAVVRVAVVFSWTENADVSWLYFWTNMEMSVSIMIACLASFRQLFIAAKAPKLDGSRRGLLISLRKLFPSTLARSQTDGMRHGTDNWPHSTSDSMKTHEHVTIETDILPLRGIHVKQDYSVSDLQVTQPPASLRSSPGVWSNVHGDTSYETNTYARV